MTLKMSGQPINPRLVDHAGVSSSGRRTRRYRGSAASDEQAKIANIMPKCHIDSMSVSLSVDEVGRIVLPKPVRDALGISGRTRLKLEVVGDVAQISREAGAAGPVKRKGQRLVFAGSLPDDWDSGAAVGRMRAQRIKR
jgi:AbrB family looped-hinge helix DNA binding protein